MPGELRHTLCRQRPPSGFSRKREPFQAIEGVPDCPQGIADELSLTVYHNFTVYYVVNIAFSVNTGNGPATENRPHSPEYRFSRTSPPKPRPIITSIVEVPGHVFLPPMTVITLA